jgi:thiamine-monophosphate kinase
MTALGEFELIARLRAIHEAGPRAAVEVGIGDDAAVLTLGGHAVWTVDVQVDHVHFERGWLSAEDIGFRAHAAATSDVYAMRARPVAALVSYVLPEGDAAVAEGLARGARASASLHGAPIVGGNLSRGTELSITTTVLGTSARPLLRRGASPGDGLYVSGPLGHAALGLRALAAGRADETCFAPFVARWRRPRLATDANIVAASAGIDVSDGLARDLGHLLEGTSLGAELHEATLVDEAFRDAAAALGEDARALALGGGEDYVLLCACSVELAGLVRIGTIVEEAGLVHVATDGTRRSVEPRGHVHRF